MHEKFMSVFFKLQCRIVIGLLRGSGFGATLPPHDREFTFAGSFAGVSNDTAKRYWRARHLPSDRKLEESALLDRPGNLSDVKAIVRSANWYILVSAFIITLEEVADLLLLRARQGIKVCVFTDRYEGIGGGNASLKLLERLVQGDIMVKVPTDSSMMHEKFIMVDGIWLFLGSSNLTERGLTICRGDVSGSPSQDPQAGPNLIGPIIGLLRGSGLGATLPPHDREFTFAGSFAGVSNDTAKRYWRARHLPSDRKLEESALLDRPGNLSDVKAIVRSANWYILVSAFIITLEEVADLLLLRARQVIKPQTTGKAGARGHHGEGPHRFVNDARKIHRIVIGLLRGSGFGATLPPHDREFTFAGSFAGVSNDTAKRYWRARHLPSDRKLEESALLDRPGNLSDVKAIVRSANWYILVSAFIITLEEVADLLLLRARQGIKVCVFTDRYEGIGGGNASLKLLERLVQGDIMVTVPTDSSMMHEKFIMVDGIWLFLGSSNLTERGLTICRGDVSGSPSQDPQAGPNLIGPIIGLLRGSGFGATLPPHDREFTFAGSFAGVSNDTAKRYWRARHLPSDRKLEESALLDRPGNLSDVKAIVRSANWYTLVSAFIITLEEVADLLLLRARQGIKVCVFTDRYEGIGGGNASLKLLERLVQGDIMVTVPTDSSMMHEKFIMIDGIWLFLGNSNLTERGLTICRGDVSGSPSQDPQAGPNLIGPSLL
ncbi:hypothetical protein ON010_g15075 [Phytophthora cinnamomi]|nr:hypothetical protein ON010_g15075 [Phytophthora cinnamomi]